MTATARTRGTTAPPPAVKTRRRSPILRWLLVVGLLWAQLGLGFSLLSDPTPKNLTLVISIEASGLYTMLLYAARRYWLPWLARRPVVGATALGIFNAAVVETLFLAVQTALGAQGVAANPNLLLDWLLTMPWYVGMVWTYVHVQDQERYSTAAVLLLGALYESGADGTLGGVVVPALLGSPPNLVQHYAFLFGLAFWQFILVYSSMVLPPAWVLEARSPRTEGRPVRLLPGLRPLLWLVPYSMFLVSALFVLHMMTNR